MPEDTENRRMSFAYFRGDFLITLAISITLSIALWIPWYMVESSHHATVKEQAKIVTAQNHFLQAVSGQTHVNPSTDLGRFVADLTPKLVAAENAYKPGITKALPLSITTIKTPNKKYNDLAFQSLYYIWGGTNTGYNNLDPEAYKEGGYFSQRFINDLTAIVAGGPLPLYRVTHQPVPNPGNTIPPIPWPVFIAWFVLLSSIAYVIAATDFDEDEGNTFFSIARADDAPKNQAIVISIIAAPVCVLLWLAVWREERYYRKEGEALMRELENTGNPMADEIKAAQAIVDKFKGNKHLHLPEVKDAFEAALLVLESAKYAAVHEKENEARKEAIDDMEALVPIAERTAAYHDQLDSHMQEHIGTRLTEITGRFQRAIGAGVPATGTIKQIDSNDDDGPITPEIVDD